MFYKHDHSLEREYNVLQCFVPKHPEFIDDSLSGLPVRSKELGQQRAQVVGLA